jgi:hypothetical protein
MLLNRIVDAVNEAIHKLPCWFRVRDRNVAYHEAAQRSGGGKAGCRTNKCDVSKIGRVRGSHGDPHLLGAGWHPTRRHRC